MNFNCKNCGKCCELNVFVTLEDINRWIDEDRMDILACLTWHAVKVRKPPLLLFIPHKKHIAGHTVLKSFYKAKWAKSNKCIFWHGNKCTIYKTRPDSCRKFPLGKLDWPCAGVDTESLTVEDKRYGEANAKVRQGQNIEVFNNREMLSKVIKKAKEDVTEHKLAKLLNSVAHDIEIQKASNDRRKYGKKTSQ